MRLLFRLFKSFMLIGIGAYGGGLVTIPLIQHEIVGTRGWLLFDEMASLLAIAQMTPGPIAVNAATFVGFRVSGLAGAAVATLGVILPSLSILFCAGPLLDRFKNNKHVAFFREGLQIGVLSLLFYATWSYGCMAVGSVIDFLLAAGAFLTLILSEGKFHPIIVILICGVLGIFLFS
ncbi:MAG TPA: chromate transporter [Firmicutes bacterium]|nr:chromate transporter [Bacillota bacterium]